MSPHAPPPGRGGAGRQDDRGEPIGPEGSAAVCGCRQDCPFDHPVEAVDLAGWWAARAEALLRDRLAELRGRAA